MGSKKKNLSEHGGIHLSGAAKIRISIVVSEWNRTITGSMEAAAVKTLTEHGINPKNISIRLVPGSFELPLGAQYAIEYLKPDAVLCIGCIIQGETRHFEFISQAVSQGIMQLNLDYSLPVIFGVLTTDTVEQAEERSGGRHGNKGVEAAAAALSMIALRQNTDNS
jgi:6,7-dimethyl-8-ribityllumazine synthase